MFDPVRAPNDRSGPDADRLLVARLSGIAQRRARWGVMDEAQKAAGAAELREIAGNRPDLLAEVAGISLGTAEGRSPSTQPEGRPSPSSAASRVPTRT
jgi:hypothetical protein